MKKIPLSGGTEFDAFTSWKKYYNWRKVTRRWVKKKYRRRFRQAEKKLLESRDD